ncbi:hypothetical protein Misp01_55260 [Microtetraspora sp. NBRC 13810]|uniref:hypothetical protein n=1 Tax=Microtetraspora sp. NBRC 13810 TaxID=3030990 RepID=UPI0024A52D38|nr:hypothetical protein [Microtetraspora sp. NBRC 13810]GLW10398.1 hypothetical protein Misp01_55260 [Microtetraspora sp. NBRC 13810]
MARLIGTAAMRLTLFGTGELARVVANSLALLHSGPLHVTIAGRDLGKAADLGRVAQTLARSRHPGSVFEAVELECFEESGPVAELLVRLAPDVVVCCASLSSSREAETTPSAWTELIGGAGFGIALPLHTVIPLTLAQALRQIGSKAVLLNSCYPDAVNPLLAAQGLPIFGGLGNAATIAAAVQAELRVADRERLHVLAHHRHLYGPAGGEVAIWLDGHRIEDAGRVLAPLRAARRSSRYPLIGMAAAHLVNAVGGDVPELLHLPGPLGHPGGYPVVVQGRSVAISLPGGVSMAEARTVNARAAEADGVSVSAEGWATPSPEASRQLAACLPELAAGFAAGDVRSAAKELLDLRARLRRCEPLGE